MLSEETQKIALGITEDVEGVTKEQYLFFQLMARKLQDLKDFGSKEMA